MRDSNMPASRGDLVLDSGLGTLDVLDASAGQSDDLLSGLIVEELDFWWGAPLSASGTASTCMCSGDNQMSASLILAGDLA